MKKLGLLAIVTLIALCLFASCGGNNNPPSNGDGGETPVHTHSFGEWDVTENPTCTENGTEERYCDCGEKQTEVIVALDHNYVDGECTNCGDIKEIPECKHGNIEVLAAKAPTCTEQGLTEGKKCTDCGEILSAQTETAMLSHTFGDWATVKEPTVTEEGLKERTCACGEKDTVIVEKLIASEGLEYELNEDGQGYTVTGLGTCTDTDIVIPATYKDLPVTSIGNWAFDGCISLTSIVIPDSVTSIGGYAFRYCAGLTSIVIPDSVETIVEGAFVFCSNLSEITLGESLRAIGWQVFSGCTGLTSIAIPDSVTSIGDFAFDGCTDLTSIVIPDSVTSIGDAAFRGCTGLTSIVIPDSVTSIGYEAFHNCTGLTSIVIGNSVTNIGDLAFLSCTGLTDVYYTGTEAEWAEISIGYINEYLTNATKHYNYVPAN